jgi:mRNA-degrading endonuclease RelE of RelBE toxin-antitoxin system
MVETVKEVIRTGAFDAEVAKIKDGLIKDRLKKQLTKVIENPSVGKPLRFDLKGERTIYIKPFRLIYAFSDGKLYLLRFEHRKKVYRDH